MIRIAMRRLVPALVLPVLAATAGCDLVTADLRAQATTEWHKTYKLDAGGRVEIANVNGKIDAETSDDGTVDVVAVERAKGASEDAAKETLKRVSIAEDVSSSHVKVETKVEKSGGGWFNGGSVTVEYRVKVPAGADVRFTTVNGGVEVSGLTGHVVAEATNGGVRVKDVAGQLEASTTNGGLDVDLARVPEAGVKLDCTNGGIKVRLPRDAKATISARITNGGISTGDLPIETSGESSRRRLDGKMNGGGPRLEIEGTNGGITLTSR